MLFWLCLPAVVGAVLYYIELKDWTSYSEVNTVEQVRIGGSVRDFSQSACLKLGYSRF